MNEKTLFEAQTIAQRLGDKAGIRFYYKAVRFLGFHQCYELTSLALLAEKEGRIKTNMGRYFNTCVKNEIEKKRKSKQK